MWLRRLHWPYLAALALLIACQGAEGEPAGNTERADATGSLALELEIADGVLIDSVRWAITGGEMEPMSGAIDTSAPGSTASVEVFGIPPDGGYIVNLEASSTDGKTTCAGSAPFDVSAGAVTEVHVMLRCKKAPRYGGVRANGELNVCAELVKVSVSSLETSVGGAIDLISRAEDAEGDPTAAMWEASVGTIADPDASITTYTCIEPGGDEIRVVVSDDGFEECMSEWKVEVTCVSVDAGCTSDSVCPDLGPCVVSGCVLELGVCEALALPDGTDCSAANPPLAECQGGVCTALGCTTDADCDDRNQCTDGFCNLAVGLCDIVPKPDDEACILPFAPFAVCKAGQCMEAACTRDEECYSTRPCVRGLCDPATGVCQAPLGIEDGTPCERIDGTPGACIDGACGCANNSVCAEASPCRSAGVCNQENGACQAGAPINEGGPCDYFARGPESGRCEDGICRAVCSANPCPDRDLDCVFDICSPVDGMCTPVARGAGTSCTLEGFPGQCDGQGSCVVESCLEPTKPINLMCTNGITPEQSPLPFTLSVLNLNGGAPLIGGSDFTVDFTGVAVFPRFFLDGAQGVVPGGVAVAELVELVATVQVRSGASGPDVPLGPDLPALTPGPTRLCNFPPDQECTADADCAGLVCEDPITLVNLPISDDCEPGGLCESLFQTGVGSQCDQNGFCVTGDLQLPLETTSGSFTANAGPGEVLFGWADRDVPGLVKCPAPAPNCQSVSMPDGCYDIPPAIFDEPAAPLGVRVRAAALSVPIQCAMAARGGICASGEGCNDWVSGTDCITGPCTYTPDVACPTPDESLIACRRYGAP